jgi:thermitase
VTYADSNYADGQVIAQLKPGASLNQVASRNTLEVLDSLEENTYVFGVTYKHTVTQAVTQLSADRDVQWVQPNYLAKVPEVDQRSLAFVDQRSLAFVDGVSPGEYFNQYAMTLIQGGDAQQFSTGIGVTVAVIDTGVDLNHPMFRRRSVTSGRDFVDNDSNPSEVCCGSAYGHGTMVAGIIALLAPGATIMPIRIFDPSGVTTVAQVTKAIRWAARNGADVINMSFGTADSSASVQTAVRYAANRNTVLVGSAGNEDSTSPRYPGAYAECISVAATDSSDVKADFSNYGPSIKVAAPGVDIYSAYPNGLWATWDGTSFAAPFVSGEAALVLAAGSRPARQIIQTTTDPVRGVRLGSGRINALKAVHSTGGPVAQAVRPRSARRR